ncbi:MAG: DUF4012 domain-containing protein [Anaerolineales bacterium]
MLVRKDALHLRDLINAPGSKFDQIKKAGPALSGLRQDFGTLENETEPFLWIGPWLGWIPVYGGDLASAQDLMNMAGTMLTSADISYRAVVPSLSENDTSGLTPTHLTDVLVRAQPQLIEADRQLNLALTFRSHLAPETLTPGLRSLILKDVDPLTSLMSDGLSIAEDFPRLMGATSEGPKTYLLLLENEDELRPTGGLVTEVGTLLMQNGHISALTFENEDLTNNTLVDWSRPYPAAPWQLQQYMNSPVLLLRDTSWFTNYPTAALYAETLYSYVKGYSVNGEIAFNQQLLVNILNVIGPVSLDGVPNPIDSGNVIDYMRTAKIPTEADLENPTNFDNKTFIQKLADVVIAKLMSGDFSPDRLFTVLLQALNEHDLLLKVDSPSITSLLASHRWDGAVRPEHGDFLMAVDTNVGFNKTNAVVSSSMVYDVDLTKPSAPIGSLTVVHTNNASEVICKQWGKIVLPGEEYYPITDCYWNYLRVYLPIGTKLMDATPQFVPANWTILEKDVPARVDNLSNDGIDGVQAFGTLQVVPGGESVVTTFQFALPASLVQSSSGQSTYHLLVQKQPGTLAEPITIRVHLPSSASILSAPAGAVVQDQNILFQTNLLTDLEFEIVFHLP